MIFLTGCSSYRQACLPSLAADQTSCPTVKVGNEVNLTLTDGSTRHGTVSSVTPAELVLGKAGNYGWEEAVIARENIVMLEVRHDSPVAGALVSITGGTLLLFAVVIMAATLSFHAGRLD